MIIGIEANHANKEQKTGVENYCWCVINNLKKQIPSDVRVILYSQKPLLPGLAENMPLNWEIKILAWPLKKLWSQLRLSLELFLNPPDVFFAPGQLIPFFSPKNTVVTIHDCAFLVNKEAYNLGGRLYLTWMNDRITKKAKVILTPSEFTRREILRLYPFLLPEQIVVTPLACDQNIYRVLKEEEKNISLFKNLKITKPFLVYLGRVEEKKNVFGLVQAFNLLKKELDVQLVLIGKGLVGFEKIKTEIENSLYKNDIFLLGWQSERDVVGLLNGAKVFILPSFYEGFGLPVLEAFSCGCPVVAAKGHSLEEVGGEAAIYFNPNNIADISEKASCFFYDEKLRMQYLGMGLERVKKFTWEQTAHNTAKILLGLQN